MKKFLKKRWLGVPVAFVTAIILILALTGSAFAYYTFFNGGATVTVNEAITWDDFTGAGTFDYPSGHWSVDMYPAETKIAQVGLYNASTVDIVVHVGITGVSDPLVGVAGDYLVPAHGGVWLPLTVTASASVAPNTFTYEVAISR